MTSHFRKALATVCALPATISVAAVNLYQVTLSPDHGPLRHLYPYGFCRHEPTCSEYAKDMLHKRSLPVALVLITRRILSCHPFTKLSDEKLRSVIRKNSDTL